jgi:hypothetical protein
MNTIHSRIFRWCCFVSILATASALAAAPADSELPYLAHTRTVSITSPDKQNYITLDEAIFQYARADLGDLRFYTTQQTEVPYAIAERRGSSVSALSTVPILNKGTVGGNAQFVVDVGIPEYDNLHLDLSTRNFVAQAKLEGANDAAAKSWSDLGTFSLFDFSKEKLGSNSTVQLHTPSRFRYLRITIIGPVSAVDVKGASIANLQQEKASYIDLSAAPVARTDGKKTVFEWDTPEGVPLDRIHFAVDAAEVNFNRPVTLYCDKREIATGDISRIKLQRKGRKIDSEDLDLPLSGLHCAHYRLEISNGDDSALRSTSIHPQMLERRAYFDPHGESSLKLYYGDDKLDPPTYDYAKLFEVPEASQVAAAALSPDAKNPAFTGRPDDRPWSEKHPAVLWIAMIVAIGLLGAWALKGFKP